MNPGSWNNRVGKGEKRAGTWAQLHILITRCQADSDRSNKVFALVQSQSEKVYPWRQWADAFDEFACQRRITFLLPRFNNHTWAIYYTTYTTYIYACKYAPFQIRVCLPSESVRQFTISNCREPISRHRRRTWIPIPSLRTTPLWAMCNSFMLYNSYLQLPATCNCI